MCMAPFLGLAIYGFDFAADVPALMNALMKLSFIRGGVVSLVLTVFGHNRHQLSCPDVYCHFDDPKVLLRYLRIENFSLLHEIGFLVAILVLFRTLFYLSLRKRFYKWIVLKNAELKSPMTQTGIFWLHAHDGKRNKNWNCFKERQENF